MVFSAFSFAKSFQAGLRGILSLAFLYSAVPLTANEPFLNKSPEEWTEAEALQVLNDSPWAHPIESTVQATPCDFEHPALPGMYPADSMYSEETARQLDSLSTQSAPETVTPDGAEYVVRLNSVKPMQAAAERLIQLSEKYSSYRGGIGFEPGSRPTNIEERWYNPADELMFSVVLKRPGPSGESFRDYAFQEDTGTPAMHVRHMFACSGIRTANGQFHGLTESMSWKDGKATGIWISFPRVVNGKPLITHDDEKVEFRLIVNQHVFATTFHVNPANLFDGTETGERIPPTVDE
jgi:hypothetical protein